MLRSKQRRLTIAQQLQDWAVQFDRRGFHHVATLCLQASTAVLSRRDVEAEQLIDAACTELALSDVSRPAELVALEVA